MRFYTHWHSRLNSTNTFLKDMVEMNPETPSGTVVAAREQTHGRGRMERVWIAEGSENLTFSLFLKNECEPCKLPSASMAAAAAVVSELQARSVPAILKWPNDVLVEDRKICGILSEGAGEGIVIGIGLNVNMTSTDHIDQPATSLLLETDERTNIDELLDCLLNRLSIYLLEWDKGGFSAIQGIWESNCPSIGKEVFVKNEDVILNGILTGFGENGELLLRGAGGRVTPVWAGDLSLTFTNQSVF